MKIKTDELTGLALDWAVGMAEGMELSLYGVDPSIRARVPGLGVIAPWRPSYYWNQGGPIIDRNGIDFIKCNPLYFPKGNEKGEFYEPLVKALIGAYGTYAYGPTRLIAAMRVYVKSVLGDTVEIPDALLAVV